MLVGKYSNLSWNSVTEDVIKYMEILITPEVVLQSTFSHFYFNCSARIRYVGPAVPLRIQSFVF